MNPPYHLLTTKEQAMQDSSFNSTADPKAIRYSLAVARSCGCNDCYCCFLRLAFNGRLRKITTTTIEII